LGKTENTRGGQNSIKRTKREGEDNRTALALQATEMASSWKNF